MHRRYPLWNERRAAYLRAQLEPGEEVLAHARGALVTDRRVLFAWNVVSPSGEDRWFHDALALTEITRWSMGRLHDERPLLRLEHPTRRRREWAPAHRVLRFRWRNGEADVPYGHVTLVFNREGEDVLAVLRDRLLDMRVPRGEDFRLARRELPARDQAAFVRA